jgi:hypothetical protein
MEMTTALIKSGRIVARLRYSIRGNLLLALIALLTLGTATMAASSLNANKASVLGPQTMHLAPAVGQNELQELPVPSKAFPPAGLSRADRAQVVTPRVIDAIRVAQQKSHVDPGLLLAIAAKESGFNPEARNRHSTARGLLQFTNATWLTVVRDFGPRYGLSRYAQAIETDRDGNLRVSKPRLRRAILALRDNPRLQAIMTAERLEQGRPTLELHLGRSARAADLYFLHLLGPTGATHFLTELNEHPDASSLTVVGGAAKANAGLFVRDGRPLTVAEAYASVQATLDEQASRHADLFQPRPMLVSDAR